MSKRAQIYTVNMSDGSKMEVSSTSGQRAMEAAEIVAADRDPSVKAKSAVTQVPVGTNRR